MSKSKTALVESSQPPELREDYPHFVVPRPDTPLSACPTTIDATTDAGKAQLIAATGTPDLSADPSAPVELDVTGYIVFPDSQIDEESGELREFNRTVLIGADGRTFASTSEVVLKRLQAMVQLWGRGPWHPPLRVSIACRIGRKRGRMFHDLRVLPRE